MTAPQGTTVSGTDDHSFPLLPPKSIEARLLNFDSLVFNTDPTSTIYKFMDALCGDAGAASLKKESFMSRLNGALETTYFSDLDYIFGNLGLLARTPYESYPYDPIGGQLTSDQWDEVNTKDAWYRDRIRKYFIACGMGGTPDGLRMTTLAATSTDCDLYEIWRYMSNYGLTSSPTIGDHGAVALGRSPVSARNEVVIVPHKETITGHEKRLLLQMLERLAPAETIVTVNLGGVAVRTPLRVQSAAADNSYYQVEKYLISTPILSQIPPPELLAVDLQPSEQWMFRTPTDPRGNRCPYTAFNNSQEYSSYYLVGGGARSPIDSVTYGTLGTSVDYNSVYTDTYGDPNQTSDPTNLNPVVPEPDFVTVQQLGQFTPWRPYPLADSPDNYPGGKYGLTPTTAPALNPDRTPYTFPYASQAAFVTQFKAAVISQGGNANDEQYQLPITSSSSSQIDYTPDLAVAYNPPAKDSSVTSRWHSAYRRTNVLNQRDPASFIRKGH